MTKVKNFAGFDVSKKFFDVAVSNREDLEKQFVYNIEGLASLIQWLPKGCHCVMEATGPYYLQLAIYLHQNGFIVSVVNPLVIKRFSQMRLLRTKTDKSDARMIAAYYLFREENGKYY